MQRYTFILRAFENYAITLIERVNVYIIDKRDDRWNLDIIFTDEIIISCFNYSVLRTASVKDFYFFCCTSLSLPLCCEKRKKKSDKHYHDQQLLKRMKKMGAKLHCLAPCTCLFISRLFSLYVLGSKK